MKKLLAIAFALVLAQIPFSSVYSDDPPEECQSHYDYDAVVNWGTIYDKDAPYRDTFKIAKLGLCDSLEEFLDTCIKGANSLAGYEVHIYFENYDNCRFFERFIDGKEFKQNASGNYEYYQPKPNKEKYTIFGMYNSMELYASNVQFDCDASYGVMGVFVEIFDDYNSNTAEYSCADCRSCWKEYPYTGGQKFHIPPDSCPDAPCGVR